MKNILFLLVSILILNSCTSTKEPQFSAKMVSQANSASVAPYFTEDQNGRPVLCWTEKDDKDRLYRLKYAVYQTGSGSFGETITVPVSAGMSSSAESMAKLAFKSDGTVYAFFAKSFPNEKNPFAGAIYYSASTDQGKHWQSAQFLHSDTAHAYSRSFFDVCRLKDGQIAAVWLDGRYGKSIKGSALFFAKTNAKAGFGPDTCLEKGTCECCRTSLIKDAQGNLHLAFRKIMLSDQLAEKQVRDMVYKFSDDNGKTFSTSKAISHDNWAIDACPHSGPTLATHNGAIEAVWFTAGGTPGLYASQALGPDKSFKTRNLITASGRHPQMLALSDGRFALVCEEPVEQANEGTDTHEPMQMHHGMSMQHGPAVPAKIVLRILQGNNQFSTTDLTDGKSSDHHAVLTLFNKALLISWIREKDGRSSIMSGNIDYKSLEKK